MMKDGKQRQETDQLKTTVYSKPKLTARADFKEPNQYPDLRPRYSKNYFPSKLRFELTSITGGDKREQSSYSTKTISLLRSRH